MKKGKEGKHVSGRARSPSGPRGESFIRPALLIGLLLGLILAVMKLMEFSYLTRDMTFEAYAAGIATIFLLVGWLVGRRLGEDRKSEGNSVEIGAPDVARETTRAAPFGDLSDREMEILERIARGKTNREIAEELFLSPNTIKSHVSNLYRKLDVTRRPEAVARAKELAILE